MTGLRLVARLTDPGFISRLGGYRSRRRACRRDVRRAVHDDLDGVSAVLWPALREDRRLPQVRLAVALGVDPAGVLPIEVDVGLATAAAYMTVPFDRAALERERCAIPGMGGHGHAPPLEACGRGFVAPSGSAVVYGETRVRSDSRRLRYRGEPGHVDPLSAAHRRDADRVPPGLGKRLRVDRDVPVVCCRCRQRHLGVRLAVDRNLRGPVTAQLRIVSHLAAPESPRRRRFRRPRAAAAH